MIQKWYVQILHISLAMAPSVKEAKDALRHALHTIADDREWRRSDWSEETKLAQFGRSGAKTAALREALYGGKLQFVCRGKDVEAFGMFKGPESFVIRQVRH